VVAPNPSLQPPAAAVLVLRSSSSVNAAAAAELVVRRRGQGGFDRVSEERNVKLNPYLMFNGQCESALKFYERCLGGKILLMMTYGDSPLANQMPPDWNKRKNLTFMITDKCARN
jgi:hypothetical protein